jgi:hypothetical protein
MSSGGAQKVFMEQKVSSSNQDSSMFRCALDNGTNKYSEIFLMKIKIYNKKWKRSKRNGFIRCIWRTSVPGNRKCMFI